MGVGGHLLLPSWAGTQRFRRVDAPSDTVLAKGYSSHWKPGGKPCLIEHRLLPEAMHTALWRRLRFSLASTLSYRRLVSMSLQKVPC